LRAMTLVSRRDLLEHSFYRRWIAGDLTLDELRDYACQYAHVVAALPKWLRQAAEVTPAFAERLGQHASEEDSHMALWRKFAKAVGVEAAELADADPNPATVELLRRGDALSALPTGAAVAWALEAQTPAVSAEKLRGLKAHYRIDSRSGGQYFELHFTRDIVHTAELEEVIDSLGSEQHPAAQHAADEITDGLWDLLTSVERAA
jgi:pyrroloquinoline-quinone synthase